MSYFQERKSSNVMKTFTTMLPPKCIVIRAGKELERKAEELVVGDIVKLRTGDKVPGLIAFSLISFVNF